MLKTYLINNFNTEKLDGNNESNKYFLSPDSYLTPIPIKWFR